MGFTRRSNGDGTAKAVECEEFAEVIYEDATVLVVNLATGIAGDGELTDALMDAIATNHQRDGAETAIATLAEAFGVDVRAADGAEQRALTIAPMDGSMVTATAEARR